jgi:hypothetical protein
MIMTYARGSGWDGQRYLPGTTDVAISEISTIVMQVSRCGTHFNLVDRRLYLRIPLHLLQMLNPTTRYQLYSSLERLRRLTNY